MGRRCCLRRCQCKIVGMENIEEILCSLIMSGGYDEAFTTWARWDAEQKYPKDAYWGIDHTKQVDGSSVDLMRRMMAIRGGELGARLAVSALFGRVYKYDATRNVWTRARYEQDREEWQRCGYVAGIEIISGLADCTVAPNICGCWRLADAPMLPPPECDSEVGCTCTWNCIFDDETLTSVWRSR